ncbi:MAG TPA: hypothetical protein VLI94_07405 [Solirubrobacterales bacterium]|nr:hypothetical protein [Solirubrobacterales bacterium]
MSDTPPTSSPPPGAAPLWGSYDGKGGEPAPAQTAPSAGRTSRRASAIGDLFGYEQLDPPSQRLLKLAGLLAVLLLLVLLNAALNSGGSSAAGAPTASPELNPVASAAERVEKFGGGRMSLYIVYSSPGLPGPLTASGSGAYNEETGRSRIALDVKNPLTGAPMRSVQISDGNVEYEGGDIIAEDLPPGKEWVRTEGEDDETSLSFEDSMELLESPETFQLVGRESINGKTARHYRGEVKINDLVDWLREKGADEKADAYEEIEDVAPTEISAEGWVDGNDLLRRLRMVIPMPGEDGRPPMTIDMRMDFFDYGAKPDIQLPDPASVVDGPLEDGGAAAPATVS